MKNRILERHLLKLNLDDCCLKDKDFSSILEGIYSSTYGVSLQNITYSNNELGILSMKSISKFIQLSELSNVKCLKELCLCSITIKNASDLRVLFDSIKEYGFEMKKLKIH